MKENRPRNRGRFVLAAIFLLGLAGGPVFFLTGAAVAGPVRERVQWMFAYWMLFGALSLIFLLAEGARRRLRDAGIARRYLAGNENSVEAAMRFVSDWHAGAAGDFTRSEEGLLIERVMEVFGLSEETAAGITFSGAAQRKWNAAA